jgi:hypothetical protein
VSDDIASTDSADVAHAPKSVAVDHSIVAPEPTVVLDEIGTEAELWVELWRAIDACILAESHLRHWLKEDHPPLTASLADGVKHYGNLSAAFGLWAGCRGIERLRTAADAWRRATAPVAVARPESKQDVPRRLL